MLRTLLVACLVFPTSAYAKYWSSRDCRYDLETVNGKFIPWVFGRGERICEIASWPISSEVAKMICEDGSRPEMIANRDGSMIFDGVHLLLGGDERINCKINVFAPSKPKQ